MMTEWEDIPESQIYCSTRKKQVQKRTLKSCSAGKGDREDDQGVGYGVEVGQNRTVILWSYGWY